MSTLPISRLIRANITLTPRGASAQDLSTLLLLAEDNVIDTVERYRDYSSLAAVVADFGSGDVVNSATLWFGQVPKPRKLKIGRWAATDALGGLRGAPLSAADQAALLASGSTTLGVNIVGSTPTNITLNAAAYTTMSQIAARINFLLDDEPLPATCSWNPVYSRFEFLTTVAGEGTGIDYFTGAAAGFLKINAAAAAEGCYTFAGMDAETPTQVVGVFDLDYGQRWYALANAVLPNSDGVDALEFAAAIEACTNKHIYGVTSEDVLALSAVSTTDVFYLLKAAGYMRTLPCYSSIGQNSVCAALAKLLTIDYNQANSTITLMYKRMTGVTAEDLNPTQADALEAKYGNVFVSYDNDTSIFERGTMSDGTFADIVSGTDWLIVTLQTEMWNILYTSKKAPQTDAGMHLLTTSCSAVCSRAVVNGLVAPGQWNADGFGTLQNGDFLPSGFYIYAQLVASQSQTDRANRLAVPIQIACKLAGAIHEITVDVNVNP